MNWNSFSPFYNQKNLNYWITQLLLQQFYFNIRGLSELRFILVVEMAAELIFVEDYDFLFLHHRPFVVVQGEGGRAEVVQVVTQTYARHYQAYQHYEGNFEGSQFLLRLEKIAISDPDPED